MPIITLTTDFGTEDAYVAQMKGVLCSAVPAHVRIMDLSHTLPPQDLHAAQRFLAEAIPTFPAGTVHLAVVDPGVGSARAPIAVAVSGQWLVAPDNGIASAALRAGGIAYTLAARKLSPGNVSSTFHGRDVFAPAAAALANGQADHVLEGQLGTPVVLPLSQPSWVDGLLVGQVVHVDHFGNLISDIPGATLRPHAGRPHVQCGGHAIGPLRDHYAEVQSGELLALLDSQGHLEIARRNGSAAEALGVHNGAAVQVRFVGS